MQQQARNEAFISTLERRLGRLRALRRQWLGFADPGGHGPAAAAAVSRKRQAQSAAAKRTAGARSASARRAARTKGPVERSAAVRKAARACARSSH
jgi:hypothetical protein